MALKRRVGYAENDAEGGMSTQLKRLHMDHTDAADEMDIADQQLSQ